MSTHDEECPGCGSSFTDRVERSKRSVKEYGETLPTELTNCPHCGSLKCCMCDMGDDVECISCGNDDD